MSEREFSLKDFGHETAVHCKTMQESKDFFEFLKVNKVEWALDTSGPKPNLWGIYKEDTCFALYSGYYDSLQGCINKNIPVVECGDLLMEYSNSPSSLESYSNSPLSLEFIDRAENSTQCKDSPSLEKLVDNTLENKPVIKKVFRLQDYQGNYAINCKTEKEAENLCKFLDNNKRTWYDGSSYKNNSNWKVFLEKTCYLFNEGLYMPVSEDFLRGHKLLNYNDFDWEYLESKNTISSIKSELKDGMILITKVGYKYLLISGKLIGINRMDSMTLENDFNEELKHVSYTSMNITKVGETLADNIGDMCKDEFIKIRWERPPVIELTLEEIKNKFGIKGEIRIV